MVGFRQHSLNHLPRGWGGRGGGEGRREGVWGGGGRGAGSGGWAEGRRGAKRVKLGSGSVSSNTPSDRFKPF